MPEVVNRVNTSTLASSAGLQLIDDFVDDLETRLSAARALLLDDLTYLMDTSLSGAGAVGGSIGERVAILGTGGLGTLSVARITNLDNLSVNVNTLATAAALAVEAAKITLLPTTTANVTEVHPAGAAPVTLTQGAGAWVQGAYGQFIAALTGTQALIGVVHGWPSGTGSAQLEIATGAAASEVVIARVPIIYDSTIGIGQWQYFPLTNPYALSNGARVAGRWRGSAGSQTMAVYIVTQPRPF